MKKIIICLSILLIIVVGCQKKEEKAIPTIKEEPEETYLFKDYYDLALEDVNKMTLEEKVGQLFIAKMVDSKAKQYVDNYHVGGFVLFNVDFRNKNKNQVINNIKRYQSYSSIPLMIAVDEEGGTVTRVSCYSNFRSKNIPSSQNLYQAGGLSLIEQVEKEKIQMLKELGINTNFAPVADVVTNSKAYMYKRSFGSDATKTSEYISRVVKIDVQEKLACSLKHFPGYGNNVDTHQGIAIDKRDYETFKNNDYLPFMAGINNDAPLVMMSHNIVTSIDDKLPASLSFNVHQELRDKLNFTGLIITDDLTMSAITKYVDPSKRSILAYTSGNDLIITGDINTDYTNLLQAFQNNSLDVKELDQRVQKILAFKYAYGIKKEV